MGIPRRARGVVIAAVALVAALAGVWVWWTGYSQPERIVQADLVSARVDAVPPLEGVASDAKWRAAEPLRADHVTIRSVHDDGKVAFLLEWDDPTFSVGTAGSWQLTSKGWRQNRDTVKWESFNGKRHPEWLGVFFDIDCPDFARKGCNATCHERTGNHHMTPGVGEHVDAWHVLAKHGWGPDFVEDQGWLAGGKLSEQAGAATFATETMDPRQPTSGTFRLAGYAEDAVLSNPQDPEMRGASPASAAYCGSCHEAPAAVVGDSGSMPYSRNAAPGGRAPLHMECRPRDFADAMVLTRAEIEKGEAPRMPWRLLRAESTAWTAYERLRATVPQLVMERPSGSAADVRVAGTWRDGRWTVGIERALVTGHTDDVQFDDLGAEYPFAVSLWDKGDLAGDLGMKPLVLSFAR